MKIWKRMLLLALTAATLTIAAAAVQDGLITPENLPLEGQFAEDATATPEYPTGTSGDAVYTLKGDTMYITGRGIFSGPANADNHPWEYYEDQIRHVVIEDGITVVGDLVFAHTYNLETVTIADSVTEICEGAFRNCYGLKSVKLPANLEKLGNFVFAYCEKLERIELPDTLAEMGGNVFDGCSALAEVRLPEKLYEIPQMSFDSCMALTEVTIPASVGFLRHASFPNCFNLKKVVFDGKQPYTNGDPFYMCPEDLVVYCYSDTEGWEEALFYTYPVVKLDRATGLPVGEKPSGGEETSDSDANASSGGGNAAEMPGNDPAAGGTTGVPVEKPENDGGKPADDVPQVNGNGGESASIGNTSGDKNDKKEDGTEMSGGDNADDPAIPTIGAIIPEEPETSGSLLPAAGVAAVLLCGGAAAILWKGKKTKK